MRKLVRSVSSFFLGLGLGIGLMAAGVVVQAQGGPFNAQIENFWRLISTGGRTFQTLSTVNATCSGTCTGFGGGGGGGTVNQWALGNGTNSATPTIDAGSLAASTPFVYKQTWNQAGTAFEAIDVNVTRTAQAVGSRYFRVLNDTHDLFTIQQDGTTNADDACLALNQGSAHNSSLSLLATNISGNHALSLGSDCAGLGVQNLGVNQLFMGSNLGTLQGGSYFTRINPAGHFVHFDKDIVVSWSNASGNADGTADIGFARNAAGVLEINNGTGGTFRDVLARALQTNPTTVGALPACAAGLKGQRQFVTDANANTFHTTAAAGGANNVAVVCDGTNWYID